MICVPLIKIIRTDSGWITIMSSQVKNLFPLFFFTWVLPIAERFLKHHARIQRFSLINNIFWKNTKSIPCNCKRRIEHSNPINWKSQINSDLFPILQEKRKSMSLPDECLYPSEAAKTASSKLQHYLLWWWSLSTCATAPPASHSNCYCSHLSPFSSG